MRCSCPRTSGRDFSVARRAGPSCPPWRGWAGGALAALAFLTLLAWVAPAPAEPSPDVDAAYAAGDLAGSRRAAEAQLAQAPADYAANWKLARALIDLGNKAPEGKEREALYTEAERRAREAVRLRPDDTWGHHYLAAAVGKLALSAGGKRKIALSKEVRDEAEKAIELDPANDKSLHILGRWNREIANLSPLLKLAAKVVYGGVPKGASNEQAVAYFQRALAVNPDHVNHHLELGLTYVEMREDLLAKEQFAAALALTPRDPNDPEYQAEARRQLERAEKRLAAPRRDVTR